MAPTTTNIQNAKIAKKATWNEVNKLKKEERKKWKEQNLLKKAEKKKLKELADNKETDKQLENSNQPSTISIAVPGSILENAQSAELRTYLAGQIARAACIFQIDEVVIFDDYGDEASAKKSSLEHDTGVVSARQSCVQLGRILQYLECPQYLRKHFFPIHQDLKYCGLLNPLNAPHHLGPKDEFLFREGVVLNKPSKIGQGSFVNVGLLKEIHVDKLLTPGLRCTVKMVPTEPSSKKYKGIVVAPSTPRRETGAYWGYSVRIATSLSKVFSQCPHKEGYDLTIGTSDKGTSVDEFSCPQFKHVLLVFGGVQGLEVALENDQVLDAEDPKLLFDHYLNTQPEQGSRTIRTEEAILISLASLRPKLNPVCKPNVIVECGSLE
ncbi:unnamed protein product [Phyllotreta striolata]|uniref:Uncharacterized protein n=1 Tax=Phyllotreta striolata TaxID=444603 RepID=A0A9N9XNI6_PHYSR|nr:unnamed protein product [Phyllotreta striolata]